MSDRGNRVLRRTDEQKRLEGSGVTAVAIPFSGLPGLLCTGDRSGIPIKRICAR